MVGHTLYTINAGDSKAVLCRLGKPITLTEDHKPGNASERARIVAAGGEVLPRTLPGQNAWPNPLVTLMRARRWSWPTAWRACAA